MEYITNVLLKSLRLQNRMTLREVAGKLGISEATVQRYESGSIRSIPYDNLVNLAKIYNVAPSYLITGKTVEDEEEPLPSFKADDFIVLELFNSLTDEQRNAIILLMRTMR